MSDVWNKSEGMASAIAGSFKSVTKTSGWSSPYPDETRWYRVELLVPKTVVAIFVVHLCDTFEKQRRMGNSYVCATDTSSDPVLANDCVPLAFASGGW